MVAPTFCRTQLHDRVTAHGELRISNDFPFVNNDTSHYDCNVAVTSACVQLARGKKLTALQVRTLGGDASGGTGTLMTSKVFKSQGMVEGVDWWRFNSQSVETVRDHLRAGHFVGLFIDNVVMNEELGGKFSGAASYDGAHAIGLCGWMRVKDENGVRRRMTWDYDPCFDGRNRPAPWPDAPFGRQRVPFWLPRKAGEHYTTRHGGGAGLLSGYAVKF